MTKITGSKDCGNSPKNQFAEKVAVAIEKSDHKFITTELNDNAVWEQGSDTISGLADCIEQLAMNNIEPTEITIDHVVTHGKAGAVNGVSRHGKGAERRFCHVLEFTSVKCTTLARICSYYN